MHVLALSSRFSIEYRPRNSKYFNIDWYLSSARKERHTCVLPEGDVALANLEPGSDEGHESLVLAHGEHGLQQEALGVHLHHAPVIVYNI